MDAFMEIKSALDIRQVASSYNIVLSGKSKAHCPFHHDTEPSMSFYAPQGQPAYFPAYTKYSCFCGCIPGGDVFDLVQNMDGVSSSLEAARVLNDRYNLGLDLDHPVETAEIRKRQKQRERKAAFEEWERYAFVTVCGFYHMLNDWRRFYIPLDPDLPMPARYAEAITRIEYIEYLLDEVFIRGDYQTKVEFYMSHRTCVEALESRLLKEQRIDAARAGTDNRPPADNGAAELTDDDFAVQA